EVSSDEVSHFGPAAKPRRAPAVSTVEISVERQAMKTRRFPEPFALALALALAAPPALQAAEPAPHGIDPAKRDRTASPCPDVYQFATGTWLANTPIPADRTVWGAGSELYEKNLEILHTILDEAAADMTAAGSSPGAKVGAFYRSGMNTAKIEADGWKP